MFKKEPIGINDHLPRVPKDESSQEAGRIRIQQGNEAWRYPSHLCRWQSGRDRPADCPQCFGEVERCPLHTPDQRLCPHRT